MENIFKRNKNPNLIAKKFHSVLLIGILGWIVFLIGEVIDNIYAGNFLDSDALSAVQVVIPFYSIIGFVGILFSLGFGLKFSTLMGRGEKEKAYGVAGESLILSIVSGVIIFLIMFFFKKQLLGIFNLTDSVYNYASQYYDWYCGIAIIYPIFSSIYFFASQDGDALWTLLSDISSVVSNIIISGILVKTMGITGLGLGTFVSISISAIVVAVHYFTKRNSIRFKIHFSFREIGECIKLGSGSSLGTLFIAVVDIVINAFIVRQFGDVYLNTYTIINFILNFANLFLCVPQSAGGFSGGAYGSKNNSDLKYCVKLEIKWTIILAIISSILMCAVCLLIPKFFGISDPTQFEYSYKTTLIIAPTFIFTALMTTIGSIYAAQEKALIGVIAELMANLVFPIVFPIAFSYAFGFYGFITGFAVSAVLSLIITIILLKIMNKSHRIFEYPEVDEYQFSVDSYIDHDSNKKMLAKIEEEFLNHGVSKRELVYVVGMLEDSFNTVIKNNPNKKVVNRITLCISDKTIRIINKNNGRILSQEEKKQTLADNNNYYFQIFANYADLTWNKLVSYNYVILSFARQKDNKKGDPLKIVKSAA